MSIRDNSPEGQRNRKKIVDEAFESWKQSQMKDLTYIKVKEGKLWASDMVKPMLVESKYRSYKEAMEAFNQSFIEVGNPDFALGVLYMSDPQKAVKVGDLVTGMQDGLYPVSGLQFEVREMGELNRDGKKFAILSLKQEQPKCEDRCDWPNCTMRDCKDKQEQPSKQKISAEPSGFKDWMRKQLYPEQPSEEKEGEYKEIKIGEVFHVGGKHYAFRMPKTASEKPNTDHGHILHEVFFVKD